MAAVQDARKTVMIITDEGQEQKVISAPLDKAGFHVLTSSCDAAIQRLPKTRESLDLAIIDLPKTHAHSAELVHVLHDLYPHIRLLFMSSNGEQDGSDLGPAGHVRGYLRKPVRRVQLLGTVLKIMDTPSILAA